MDTGNNRIIDFFLVLSLHVNLTKGKKHRVLNQHIEIMKKRYHYNRSGKENLCEIRNYVLEQLFVPPIKRNKKPYWEREWLSIVLDAVDNINSIISEG